MRRTACFVDMAYLQCLQHELAAPAVSFSSLATAMAAGGELLRTYVYDALPHAGNPPTPEGRRRLDNKHRFVTALSHLPRFEVRLGRVEYRGRNTDGTPIFEQKRVDVSQAVDLTRLAAKHLISDAAFLAGDSDFVPAIEAAKADGVLVRLFHGPNAHRDLVRACDERTLITHEFLERLSRDASQSASQHRPYDPTVLSLNPNQLPGGPHDLLCTPASLSQL